MSANISQVRPKQKVTLHVLVRPAEPDTLMRMESRLLLRVMGLIPYRYKQIDKKLAGLVIGMMTRYQRFYASVEVFAATVLVC